MIGQSSGVVDYNYPLFNKVAALLRAEGFQVFNPAENKDGNQRLKENAKCSSHRFSKIESANSMTL